MKYNNIMHVAFYTEHMDEMMDFYIHKLGGTLKVCTKYGVYLNRDDRPAMQAIAKTDPDKVFNCYIELASGQFIELFPAMESQKPHTGFNEYLGYSHFALTVDDIFAAKEELENNGVVFITEPSKGPSETWQMWTHDPDGNYFEVMQYTENSVQVKGNV